MKKLYFLSIHLPAVLEEQVLSLKLEIRERFQAEKALRLPGHITLVPPRWIDESLEESLVLKLSQLLKQQPAFLVELKDFGAFVPLAVYISVVPNQGLTGLKKMLTQTLQRAIIREEDTDTTVFVPHVTIANRDLSRENFHPAWEEFQDRKFKGDFVVQQVYLLKHNGKKWEVLKELPLAEKEIQIGSWDEKPG